MPTPSPRIIERKKHIPCQDEDRSLGYLLSESRRLVQGGRKAHSLSPQSSAPNVTRPVDRAGFARYSVDECRESGTRVVPQRFQPLSLASRGKGGSFLYTLSWERVAGRSPDGCGARSRIKFAPPLIRRLWAASPPRGRKKDYYMEVTFQWIIKTPSSPQKPTSP